MVIDAETLLDTLFKRDKAPSWTVQQNADVDSIAKFPFVNWDLNLSGQISNGPGLWTGQVDVNVFHDLASVFDIAAATYDLIHAWDDNNTGVVAGTGWVHTVTDVSAFTSVDEPLIGGRTVGQYAGSFALLLRH